MHTNIEVDSVNMRVDVESLGSGRDYRTRHAEDHRRVGGIFNYKDTHFLEGG